MKPAKKLLFLIYLIVAGGFSALAHPFYVSICQVDFNRETHSLEISVKTFADDLIAGLEKNGASKIYLGEQRENTETDKWIAKYIKSGISFVVNGKNSEIGFIGKEIETDVVWSYFEITNVSELTEMEVHCTLLTEIFETQNNIIQINNGEEIKNLLLSKKKTTGSVNF